jgi:hypothetical protein
MIDDSFLKKRGVPGATSFFLPETYSNETLKHFDPE